jgi:hypothetical protein
MQYLPCSTENGVRNMLFTVRSIPSRRWGDGRPRDGHDFGGWVSPPGLDGWKRLRSGVVEEMQIVTFIGGFLFLLFLVSLLREERDCSVVERCDSEGEEAQKQVVNMTSDFATAMYEHRSLVAERLVPTWKFVGVEVVRRVEGGRICSRDELG